MWVLDTDMEQYIINNFIKRTSYNTIEIQLDESNISKKIRNAFNWYMTPDNLRPDNYFGKFRILNLYGCFPLGINSDNILIIHFDKIDLTETDKIFNKYNLKTFLSAENIKTIKDYSKKTNSDGFDTLIEVAESAIDVIDFFF